MRHETAPVDHLVCRLIDLCREEKDHFHAAADVMPSRYLQSLLHAYGRQREAFCRILEKFLPAAPMDTRRQLDSLAALSQEWTDFRLARAAGDEMALLAGCEQGEMNTWTAYDHALSRSLPANLSAVLRLQRDELEFSWRRMQQLGTTVQAQPVPVTSTSAPEVLAPIGGF